MSLCARSMYFLNLARVSFQTEMSRSFYLIAKISYFLKFHDDLLIYGTYNYHPVYHYFLLEKILFLYSFDPMWFLLITLNCIWCILGLGKKILMFFLSTKISHWKENINVILFHSEETMIDGVDQAQLFVLRLLEEVSLAFLSILFSFVPFCMVR